LQNEQAQSGPQNKTIGERLVFIMKNMEQAEGFKANLQFFAEPGYGAETPPSEENYDGNSGDSEGQAVTPPTNEPVGQTQTQFTPEQYQNAIKGMNQAQQEAAAYRKLGLTPEQIQERNQFYQQASENPQQLIENYVLQNPQMFQTLMQKFGPQMATQMMFNNMQQPQDPYTELGDISDPIEYAKRHDAIHDALREKELEKMFEEKYGSKIKAIEQTFQQQKDAVSHAKINDQINAFIKTHPDSGVTTDAIWQSIQKQGIPLDVLIMKPGLIRDEIANAMGGWDKYEEFIGKINVQKNKEQILNNRQSTAQLTPSGGVPAVTGNQPFQDEAKIKEAGLAMIANIMAAQKG
jgi:hypothetical protein